MMFNWVYFTYPMSLRSFFSSRSLRFLSSSSSCSFSMSMFLLTTQIYSRICFSLRMAMWSSSSPVIILMSSGLRTRSSSLKKSLISLKIRYQKTTYSSRFSSLLAITMASQICRICSASGSSRIQMLSDFMVKTAEMAVPTAKTVEV